MMEVWENVDLFPFNTFKMSARARYFVTVSSVNEVRQLITTQLFKEGPFLILGGGSNILLTGDFDGLVIKNELKGIDVVGKTDNTAKIRAGSGEVWHDLVMYCVSNDYGGIENLSLIPGTVGAAPIQNIGAYGREVREVIEEVEAISLENGDLVTFTNEQCRFGYRESVFKQELKNKYFISSITLDLTRNIHNLNTGYGAITEALKRRKLEASVKTTSDAVIEIRSGKLTNPEQVGNAGSFYKNPTITQDKYSALKKKYPSIPSFPGEHHMVKVPAAWLIEQCGWKGQRFGNIGVHKDQALVLVNYGNAEGSAMLELSRKIQQSVEENFGIRLQPEVNVI